MRYLYLQTKPRNLFESELLIISFLQQQLSLFTRHSVSQSVRGSILTAEPEPEPARHQDPLSLSPPAGHRHSTSPTQHNSRGILFVLSWKYWQNIILSTK